ncbi:MAG: ABC transporter ATP-binding protein [Hydrogenibacillus schlegelii]|uniref:ABC transporter ATP-binding protein n=1 Tax=Hydrogenibacillus schlegelii TaxID=1484 RepID=A0A947CYQ8_HYDSH|nr:ABC transporter ATP-binding protein [Hydrogenibacillus schlegelii]
MAFPFLKVEGLSLTLKGEPILKNVSLEAYPGEVVGIVGRNGSGKSMLFKCIAGLVTPQSGEVWVGDFDVVKKRRFPPDFGALIEKPGFIGSLSAYENLKILASIQGKIGRAEIMEALRIVGLEHAARTKVRKFSVGMKQRLGIAQAFMERPKLLLLDEPTSGLDADGVAMLHDLVKRLKAEGVTILLTSHIREDIEALSDRVLQMDRGSLAALNGF